jgi:hypothetical protein
LKALRKSESLIYIKTKMQVTTRRALGATSLVLLVVLVGLFEQIECKIDWMSLLVPAKSDPDEYIPTPELIRSKGYPAEEHHVITKVRNTREVFGLFI